MANQAEKLDQVFRDNLGQHSIQPSKLAWERLENELPKNKKKPNPFWWAAAAVVFLSAIGFALLSNQETTTTNDFVAEEIVLPSEKSEEPIETTQENTTKPTITTPKEEKPSTTQVETTSTPSPKKESEATSNTALADLTETSQETKEGLRRPEREIPITTIERSFIAEVAINAPQSSLPKKEEKAVQTEEEPAYRVTILSDGIKETKDKNLIAGLGKTVGQVEGILGKVDQGLGDLQDAKNNLFASLISKKERGEEKP